MSRDACRQRKIVSVPSSFLDVLLRVAASRGSLCKPEGGRVAARHLMTMGLPHFSAEPSFVGPASLGLTFRISFLAVSTSALGTACRSSIAACEPSGRALLDQKKLSELLLHSGP